MGSTKPVLWFIRALWLPSISAGGAALGAGCEAAWGLSVQPAATTIVSEATAKQDANLNDTFFMAEISFAKSQPNKTRKGERICPNA